MWQAAIPAAISAVGQIAGAFGGGAKSPRVSQTSEMIIGQRKYDQNLADQAAALGFRVPVGSYIKPNVAQAIADSQALKAKMASAKQNGIHPLMALGMPTSSTSYQTASTSSGGGDGTFSRMADAGADFARAITQKQSNLEVLQERLLSAQIEGQEIDNVSRASQIARTNQPANGYGTDPRYPQQLAMPLGYGDSAPLLRMGRDARGNPIRVYNDDLGDNELLQAASAIMYSFPDWLQSNLTRPAGQALRNAWHSNKSRYGQFSKFRK